MAPERSPRLKTVLGYVGANVRRLRLDRGLTQRDLANGAGLKERYVQLLEAGKANPTVGVLLDVADILGASPSEFFAPAKSEQRLPGNPRLPR